MKEANISECLQCRCPSKEMYLLMAKSCRWNFGEYDELIRIGFDHSELHTEFYDDIQILLACKDHTGLVAFRGGHMMPRSMCDMDHFLMPFENVDPGSKVHSFFLRGYNIYRQRLYKFCSDNRIDTLYCVGHSFGGCVAQMAAVDMGSDIDTICITFGSPKVGDRWFARLFNEKVDEYIRYVVCDDPIPEFPLDKDYVHAGEATVIGPQLWRLKVLRKRITYAIKKIIFGTPQKNFYCELLKDDDIMDQHDIVMYLVGIKEFLQIP